MSATLQAFLRSSCRGLGVDPRYLDSPAAAEDPLTALLQEAIALREEQRAELSLQVLEIASAAGLSSEWIDDNRARALLALDRADEARHLLHSLCDSATEAIAAAARSQLEALTREPQADEGAPPPPAEQEASAPSQPETRAADEQEPSAAPDAADTAETSEAAGPPETGDDSGGDPPELIALLEQAIELREQGLAQASLELLQQAQAAGFRSPWLQDNRARALVQLGRRFEAIGLWQQLEASGDPDLAAMAGPLAQTQGRELVADLQTRLGRVAAEHGASLEGLAQAGDSPAALQEAILLEAIALRERGQAAASLALLDAAIEAGLPSGWLQDNRARALVHLQRPVEAVALWRQLQHHDDGALAQAAQQMLELYGRDADRLEISAKADALLRSNEPDQAIELLSVAVLNDPEWDGWRDELKRAVALREPVPSQAADGLLAQELREPRLALQAFDAFLTVVEQRQAARS